MSVCGWVCGLSLMGLYPPWSREPFERSLIPSRQQDDGRLPGTSKKTYFPHDMRFSLQVKNKIVSNKNDSPCKMGNLCLEMVFLQRRTIQHQVGMQEYTVSYPKKMRVQKFWNNQNVHLVCLFFSCVLWFPHPITNFKNRIKTTSTSCIVKETSYGSCSKMLSFVV